MRCRFAYTSLAVLALALWVGRAALADHGKDEGDHHHKPHEGTVVKAGDGKLTMTYKGSSKEHSHDVAADAKITVDGQEAKLEDLKEGFHVKVTVDENHAATKIEAHSKHQR